MKKVYDATSYKNALNRLQTVINFTCKFKTYPSIGSVLFSSSVGIQSWVCTLYCWSDMAQ